MDPMLPGNGRQCPSPKEVLDLAKELCQNHDRSMSFTSFSPSLYDVAWLSMVPNENDRRKFMFPQCLDIVLRSQQADGTWPSYAVPTDGILNSLVALLSVVTHRDLDRGGSSEQQRLLVRAIECGVSGLESLLQSWDAEQAIHVGFELLVTTLLRGLEKFDIRFDFQARRQLDGLYQKKMARFSPEIVYSSRQVTPLHSIEAFVDVIDFDRISHHCSDNLGIFGSPAATAAYLIHSSTWDGRAEKYLRQVVACCGNQGMVPSAFPTTLFEVSWLVSSMLSPIVDCAAIGNVDLDSVRSLFEEILERQGGLAGFAPGILEDADDTARVLLTLLRLRRLGQATSPDVTPMVQTFETGKCFKTYELERNASLSANCNVLLALLDLEVCSAFQPQIEKALGYLLDSIESENRHLSDKWNLSSEYVSMLLIEVLVLALRRFDSGELHAVPEETFLSRFLKALCRLSVRLLQSQRADGSWQGSLEGTSYASLAISHLLRLPWSSATSEHLAIALSRGRTFVETEYPRTQGQDYLWIEKTTFQSSLLRMAYCSMALHVVIPDESWSGTMTESFSSDSRSSSMKGLFLSLPMLQEVNSLILDLLLVEAKFHARDLASIRNAVLPRDALPLSKDKYLGYIPVIWLICNYINDQALSRSALIEMLKLSQLTFQIDEYMETVVAGLPYEQISVLERWIPDECITSPAQSNGNNGHLENHGSREGPHERLEVGHVSGSSEEDDSRLLSSVQSCLRKFAQYILRHDVVQKSSPIARSLLAQELSQFLLAHMRQNSDNLRLKSSKAEGSDGKIPEPGSGYFRWVRSTGANHTSCPFAFQFYMCLICHAEQSPMCFEGTQARYISASVARHLATMCRQYNDYGSIARDYDEHNLNSVDFAEFLSAAPGFDPVSGHPAVDRRESLMAVAEFERQLMELSFRALKKVVDAPAVTDALKVLIDVTDLFGQLYVAKDIASRKRKA